MDEFLMRFGQDDILQRTAYLVFTASVTIMVINLSMLDVSFYDFIDGHHDDHDDRDDHDDHGQPGRQVGRGGGRDVRGMEMPDSGGDDADYWKRGDVETTWRRRRK